VLPADLCCLRRDNHSQVLNLTSVLVLHLLKPRFFLLIFAAMLASLDVALTSVVG
jgi:hypothetical protein